MLDQRIQQQFFEGADLQYQTAEGLARPIAEAVEAVVAALTAGGKLLLCGHRGASALLAQHAAALLVGTLERDRPPLAALALAPDPRAIQGLGLPGDLLLLVDPSASDLDASMAAVRAAQGKDMTVVLLVGSPAAPAWVKLWPKPTC
jgi:D-sedoheptulose 7-phosphate isomerase